MQSFKCQHYFALSSMYLISSLVVAAENEDKLAVVEKAVTPSMIDSSRLVDTSMGLIVVLGLMLGLAWLVKRYVGIPGMSSKGAVKVIGGVSLGPRERAVVVSVDGKRLLLGVAPGRVQMLHVLDDEASFSEQLTQAQEQVQQDESPQVISQ